MEDGRAPVIRPRVRGRCIRRDRTRAAGAQQSNVTCPFRYEPVHDLVIGFRRCVGIVGAAPCRLVEQPAGSRSVPLDGSRMGAQQSARFVMLASLAVIYATHLRGFCPRWRRALDYRRDSDSPADPTLFRRSSCEHLVMCNPAAMARSAVREPC